MRTCLVVIFILGIYFHFTGDAISAGDKPTIGPGELPSQLSNRFTIACYLTPCSLSADFDGDGKADRATLVMQSTDHKKGIAIVHGSGKVVVLGPGNEIGNGGDDYSWMDNWRVVKGTTGGSPDLEALNKNDSLFVEKTMAASALIYWDGANYAWKQIGD